MKEKNETDKKKYEMPDDDDLTYRKFKIHTYTQRQCTPNRIVGVASRFPLFSVFSNGDRMIIQNH